MSSIDFGSIKNSMPSINKIQKAPRVAQWKLIERLQKRIWTSFDGTTVPIRDMSTNHIKNCIKQLMNGSRALKTQWIKVLTEELKQRNTQDSMEALTEILLFS